MCWFLYRPTGGGGSPSFWHELLVGQPEFNCSLVFWPGLLAGNPAHSSGCLPGPMYCPGYSRPGPLGDASPSVANQQKSPPQKCLNLGKDHTPSRGEGRESGLNSGADGAGESEAVPKGI